MQRCPGVSVSLSFIAALATLTACDQSSPPEDASTADAATQQDAGGADSGPADAGATDAGVDAGPPEPAPIFRNPVDMADFQLAREALRLLGAPSAGGSGSCTSCHGVTRRKVRDWQALTEASYASCFTDLEPDTPEAALAVVDCLRGDGEIPYHPSNLGALATAARLPWFGWLFRRAYGEAAPDEYRRFVERAAMPPSFDPFSQGEFDIVAEWFLRGAPELSSVLPADPPPTECEGWVSPTVATHVAEMALSGWAARNADAGILMHGCAGAADTLDCLSSETLASETAFGADWNAIAGAKIRVLYTTSYHSSFWTRSSADGRFVGHGGGPSTTASIIDLLEDRVIGVEALYDPGFFPDNSGFIFMGGGGVCEQSILTTGTPTRITFGEPQCRATSMVGLYEHVGASLDGGDYWAVHGQFVSDSGGHSVTRHDPRADFGSTSRTELTRMINVGDGFVADRTLELDTPYEGDAAISPSSRLMVSRLAGPGSDQLGFVLRRLETTREGEAISIDAPEIARYCVTGGKPAFSYDERWMITHHYIGDDDADAIELGFKGLSDPGFAEYQSRGAANLYLIEIATGEVTRLTNMQPGQYALFPHFRSDGWIYFMVRVEDAPHEHVAATDAALILSAP